MSIKIKLLLQAIFLAVIPALVVALLITEYSKQSSFTALENKAQEQLVSLRELKKSQIVGYLNTVQSQVQQMSKNLAVIDASQAFVKTFATVEKKQLGKSASTALTSYYQNEFAPKFNKSNSGDNVDVSSRLNKLDEYANYYQDKYIAQNRFPLGEKDKLINAGNSAYDVSHAKYHAMFRDFLNEYGYYDIFIVDANTGRIVYSVFKELDFATSLVSGPYNHTAIADVFQQSLNLQDANASSFVDFQSYFPSYNSGASFIASPITANDGKVNSVLIFQMPVNGINQIMTSGGQWQSVGLGLSGETYLVGENKLLRSESRFLIDDKAGYLKALKNSGDQPNLTQIDVSNSALNLQFVKTPGVNSALSGDSGFARFNDYRGVEVFSAYTSIEYGGQRWALMAEMDADEVLASAVLLSEELQMYSLISLLTIAVVSVIIGLIISTKLVTPIRDLVELITDISEGDGDLTVELALAKRTDEIGDVGKAFNTFVKKIRNIVIEIDGHAGQLASSSEELEAVTNETNNVVILQKHKTQATQQTVSEFSGSIGDIADNSLHTADLTEQANSHSIKGATLSKDAKQAIHNLVGSVSSAATELEDLNEHVEDITSILSVIQSISEQTNLLALNAAIEASRAGESGRGFSVVADEVRSLASKTQASTIEIQSKIEGLRNSSSRSIVAMENAHKQANTGIQLVQETASNLQLVAELVADVKNKNSSNATVAQQQSSSVNEVHQNIIDIASYTDTASSASLQTSQASSELARLAVNMSTLVKQFKY